MVAWAGVSGVVASDIEVKNSAHIVANNSRSAGFKKPVQEFASLFSEVKRYAVQDESGAVSTAIYNGLGVAHEGTTIDMSQGEMIPTEDPLDLAIEGEGLFAVKRGDETVYTRDGRFKKSPEGKLVTRVGGYEVSPGIQLNPKSAAPTINSRGEVFEIPPGEQLPVKVGQIDLAKFSDPTALKPVGNFYEATVDSGEAIIGAAEVEELGSIRQGFKEAGNGAIIQEMVALLKAEKASQAASEAIKKGFEIETASIRVGAS